MKVNIGLFGFGVVGQGFYHILSQKNGSAPGRVTRICVRNRDKQRSLPAHHFTFDPADILDDPDITHVVELTDQPEDAFQIVQQALQRGKTVISANKKMLSDRLSEIFALQGQYPGALLYEASACGSIPVFQNLERYYAHDEVHRIQGIFNGSTNYILTQMTENRLSYAEALAQAQALGFAETDPALDVEAHDPASKLALLTAHALGCLVTPEAIFRFGIRTIQPADIAFAARQGRKIRLLGQATLLPDGCLEALVLPAFVPADSPFYALNNEYNGVHIQSKYMGNQLLSGKGAGSLPTGFAVLGDLAASVRPDHAGYTRMQHARSIRPNTDTLLHLYLRFPDAASRALLPELVLETQENTAAGIQALGHVALHHLMARRQALLDAGVFLARWED